MVAADGLVKVWRSHLQPSCWCSLYDSNGTDALEYGHIIDFRSTPLTTTTTTATAIVTTTTTITTTATTTTTTTTTTTITTTTTTTTDIKLIESFWVFFDPEAF